MQDGVGEAQGVVWSHQGRGPHPCRWHWCRSESTVKKHRPSVWGYLFTKSQPIATCVAPGPSGLNRLTFLRSAAFN